jgi:hypothetical protein
MLINNIDLGRTKKVKSEYNYIDLQKLSENFKLDMDYSPPEYHPYGELPGFIGKSYYQSKPEIGYNFPPKGPIEPYFICTYCKNTGPNFHKVNCKRPFTSSLVLTQEGSGKYSKPFGTSYLLVVKKKGQKKIVTSSIKSERFTDNVEVVYQEPDFSKTVVRIARNGSINVISAKISNKTMIPLLLKKINEAGAFTSDFPYPKIELIPEISYKYLLAAQYNLFEGDFIINLDKLNDDLSQNPRFRKMYKSKDVFMLDTTTNIYFIGKYVYNSGDIESRSNKQTNPYILINLIDPANESVKITILIYKKGAVQLKESYTKDPNPMEPLTVESIQKAYSFIKEIISRLIRTSEKSKYPIVTQSLVKPKEGIDNMYDGKQPQACQNHEGYELRPVPFSFTGKCQIPGYYVAPRGKKRPDGRYEPCCYQLKKSGKDSKKRFHNMLINGYPDPEATALYNENIPDPDNLSAVFVPGTDRLESRRFKGLKDLSKEQLINCIEESGHIKKKSIFDASEDYNSLKEKVLAGYSSLTGTRVTIEQHPVALTTQNVNSFLKNEYLIVPVYQDTISVLLFFSDSGESYFININGDISESGLPQLDELSGTLIQGYLYPFEEPNFIFYPFDILFYRKKNVMSVEYYQSRFTFLTKALGVLSKYRSSLNIESSFDLDIISGANHYLESPEVSSLLFIPRSPHYEPRKINKNLLLWTDIIPEHLHISLVVTNSSTNRWAVTIDSKSIPESLLPQVSGTIEIPVKFKDSTKLLSGDIVLFKIQLNPVTKRISTNRPLVPVEKLESQINDYPEVITILQSIENPIKRKDLETFTIQGKKYISTGNGISIEELD